MLTVFFAVQFKNRVTTPELIPGKYAPALSAS